MQPSFDSNNYFGTMSSVKEISILEGDKIDYDEKLEKTFTQIFKTVAHKNPKSRAIVYKDVNGFEKSISYELMDKISDEMAKILQKYILPNDSNNYSIAVALTSSEYLPVILLAILKAGLSYLPIDMDSPVHRLKHILNDSRPFMCIANKTADEILHDYVTTISEEELINKSHQQLNRNIQLSRRNANIAIVLYTSGSTGAPKGVLIQYSALMNRLRWQWRKLPYRNDEKYCVFKTALTFVDSVCEIWGPLLQGRTLVIISKEVTKDPEKFTSILIEYKVQRIVLVPSLLKSILLYLKCQKEDDNIDSLWLWICSGEKLLVSLVNEFYTIFAGKNKVVVNLYGSTEIMGDVTFYKICESDPYLKQDEVPIGQPIDNCITYITDSHFNVLPEGEVGELLIAGKNVTKGYVNNDNAMKFLSNSFPSKTVYPTVYRTGDYVKMKNSLLFYEGRRDSQVKIRGKRVDLTEIEKSVLNIPIVNDAVVLPYEMESSEQVLLCFVVLKEENLTSNSTDVVFHLTKALPSHMIPQVIVLKKIPLLTNGKTDRQNLLEVYIKKLAEDKKRNAHNDFDFNGISAQQISRAKVLFSVVASTTGINDKSIMNINSNFYELGGNSLNSVYAVLKLREKGFYIGITDFITAKSMRHILEKMQEIDVQRDIKVDNEETKEYDLEMLNNFHKDEVIRMITDSFFSKADLERWLIPEIKKEDYFELMQKIWDALVEKKLSFVLKSADKKEILSVSLNFDARDEPEVIIESKLSIIFDFLEYIEGPVREAQLPKGKNQIFHTFMMATSNGLHPSENVILMKLMEQKCLEIAIKNKFFGILTTNTSPLTQQLGTDIFNYEVLLDYQVNKYITAEGIKPFAKAPDDQRAVVSWKKINSNK